MTSSAAAGVYLERHVANLRLGMTLELFTAFGALVGGSIAFLLDERLLDAAVRRPAASTSRSRCSVAAERGGAGRGDRRAGRRAADADRRAAATHRSTALSGTGYRVRNLGLGVVGATFAGVVSALLGIGGGIVKVPLMHLVMGVPLRVATATSNLMIGITAAASAIIYLLRGEIDPYVAGTDRHRRLHRRERRLPPRPPRSTCAILRAAVRGGPALHRRRRCS